MEQRKRGIDEGVGFDWGKTSEDYGRYRDIYPPVFYEKIAARNLCVSGQRILDLGTGTGVLPRNMYSRGAEWVGVDLSENQIAEAKKISAAQKKDIQYIVGAAEKIDFPLCCFDVVTACQCFWYFDHKELALKLWQSLKEDGKLLILYMAWLPFKDEIAGASEQLVLEYSPQWTGAGEWLHPIQVPDCVSRLFEPVYHEEYEIELPFTRESWNGRMKTCRGIGASLEPEQLREWEERHRRLLQQIAPERFFVKHYAAMLEMKRRHPEEIVKM